MPDKCNADNNEFRWGLEKTPSRHMFARSCIKNLAR